MRSGESSPPLPPQAGEPPELLPVGRVVAAQGLRGELRVLPLSDFPERFTRPGNRWLQGRSGPARPVELLSGRVLPGKDLFVVRLAGVEDRTGAEALVGSELLVSATDRPPLGPGEFHVLDLVGLAVHLLGSEGERLAEPIGTVTDLLHCGNDLLEVELAAGPAGPGPRRVLIPFVEPIVPVVNTAEGWVGLTPPPGLLDLDTGTGAERRTGV